MNVMSPNNVIQSKQLGSLSFKKLMDIYATESMRILWYLKRQSQVYGMVTKLNEAATACHIQGTSIQVNTKEVHLVQWNPNLQWKMFLKKNYSMLC